jgi:NAD(P)H-nitrite reductase large subunit
MPKRYVIIGNGPAGLNAVRSIRKYDTTGQIFLISNEPPYYRMLIPYYLSGIMPMHRIFSIDEQFYRDFNVVRLSGEIVSLRTDKKEVYFDDGRRVGYDTLIIATGCRPKRLDIPGIQHAIDVWSLKDAQKISAEIKRGRRVIIIGAGFTGFSILNALMRIGASIMIIEIQKQVLPFMLDKKGAEVVQNWIGEAVEFLLDEQVEEIGVDSGGAKVVRTKSGRQIKADVVLSAIGVLPSVEFLQDGGLMVDGGIIVDGFLRASAVDVFACGNVAKVVDFITSKQVIYPNQTSAVEQGLIAGENAAGANVKYQGALSMNLLDVGNLWCASIGNWGDERDVASVCNMSLCFYRKLVFDRERLAGAILIGRRKDISTGGEIGMIKGLIQSRINLGRWKEYLMQHPHDVARVFLGLSVPSILWKG